MQIDRIVNYLRKNWKVQVAEKVQNILMKEELKHNQTVLVVLKNGLVDIKFFPDHDHPPVDVVFVDMDVEGSGVEAIVEVL